MTSFVRDETIPGGGEIGGKRQIAFFIQDLRAGGAERAIIRLVNSLVEQNVDVELLVVSKSGAFFSLVDSRVKVVELGRGRTLLSIFALRNYIERNRPKALVASMTHLNVAAILAKLASRHKPRLIVVEHNQIQRNAELKRGLVRLAYRAVPYLYKSADVVAAVSKGVRASLSVASGIAEDKIEILYNPVISKEIFDSANEEAEHPWLKDRKAPVLLAVGRLMKLKNFPLLVDAFARVRRARPVRLIVLGEGELRESLESQAKALGVEQDIDFAGFRPNPFAFMRRADVFVLSSNWEGHPTVMIEAMACGAPVVSTNCVSGPAEILADGKFGRLVEPGNAEQLARAIEAALDDPGDPAPRIERAREFNVRASAEGYLRAAGMDSALS